MIELLHCPNDEISRLLNENLRLHAQLADMTIALARLNTPPRKPKPRAAQPKSIYVTERT